MEQNSNITPIPPFENPQSSPPLNEPKKKWPFSRKITIIGIISLVIIVALAITFLAMMGGKKDTSKQEGPDSSLYFSRPGYDMSNEGIGDAAALVSETTSNTVSYKGAPALQPCTLLTITDVQDMGLKITPNQLTGPVQQAAFDGQGLGVIDTSSRSFLPSDPDGSFCDYMLTDEQRIIVTTYQSSFASPAALEDTLGRNFAASADVEGVKTYISTRANSLEPNETSYILRDGTNAVKIDINVAGDMKEKILKHVAKQFAASKTKPMTTQKYAFKSPVFPVAAISSCDIMSAADFKTVLGVDSSPIVTESFGTAVGVITLGGKNHNYVSYECVRRSPEGLTGAMTMRMMATTYETADAAKQALAFERAAQPFTKNLQEISPAIGDESFYADLAEGNKIIALRKGRVIIKTNFYATTKDASITPEKRIQTLSPVLQGVVSTKLKDF